MVGQPSSKTTNFFVVTEKAKGTICLSNLGSEMTAIHVLGIALAPSETLTIQGEVVHEVGLELCSRRRSQRGLSLEKTVLSMLWAV